MDAVVGPVRGRRHPRRSASGRAPAAQRPRHPGGARRGRADRDRPGRRRADGLRRRRRRLHRPGVDGAVDPAGQRVRGRLRAVHGGRVRPDRPAPHAHVRHDAEQQLATVGGDDPQQRPRQPRGRVLRPGPVHARGHPRLADGRRSVPSPRLRDDVRGRVRHSCWPAPTAGRRDDSRAVVDPRRRRATASGPAYHVAPRVGHAGQPGRRDPTGWVGAGARPAAAFAMAGLGPADVDVAELYDPFSFEIIRQLEAYGFCARRRGRGLRGRRARSAPGGSLPVTTDGGTMSFSHAGQRGPACCSGSIRAVQQVRGECRDHAGARRRGRDLLERWLGRAVHRRAAAGAGPAMSGPTDEILAPQQPGFPVPPRSARSAPFWEGCRAGASGAPPLFGLRHACPASLLRVRALRHAGRGWPGSTAPAAGTLYSWTVVWRAPHPGFATPYAPAVVRLDDGWTMLSAVVGLRTRGAARRPAAAGRVPPRLGRGLTPLLPPRRGLSPPRDVPLRPGGAPNPGGDLLRNRRPGNAACLRRPRRPS